MTSVIAEGLRTVGDERLLRIVLDALLGNAWKFSSKSDHPTIEFGARMIDGEEAYFVRDNGAGFDAAHATRLFAPFQRLHSEEDFAGRGMGLAIVRRIVGRHGGRVWASGDLGKGATVLFTLARRPAPS